jgi:hypothetical protein
MSGHKINNKTTFSNPEDRTQYMIDSFGSHKPEHDGHRTPLVQMQEQKFYKRHSSKPVQIAHGSNICTSLGNLASL